MNSYQIRYKDSSSFYDATIYAQSYDDARNTFIKHYASYEIVEICLT